MTVDGDGSCGYVAVLKSLSGGSDSSLDTVEQFSTFVGTCVRRADTATMEWIARELASHPTYPLLPNEVDAEDDPASVVDKHLTKAEERWRQVHQLKSENKLVPQELWLRSNPDLIFTAAALHADKEEGQCRVIVLEGVLTALRVMFYVARFMFTQCCINVFVLDLPH